MGAQGLDRHDRQLRVGRVDGLANRAEQCRFGSDALCCVLHLHEHRGTITLPERLPKMRGRLLCVELPFEGRAHADDLQLARWAGRVPRCVGGPWLLDLDTAAERVLSWPQAPC